MPLTSNVLIEAVLPYGATFSHDLWIPVHIQEIGYSYL